MPPCASRHTGFLVTETHHQSAALDLLQPAVLVRSPFAADAANLIDVYRPQNPTVAFSARDLRSPGIADAVQAATHGGFGCVVRSPGGRVVAYDSGAVVIDHIMSLPLRGSGPAGVFAENAHHHLAVLRSLCKADLRVGEVEDEYCPGEFSINVGGTAKVVGSAQRVTSRAALFSTVVQVEMTDRVRDVLIAVSAALGYPLRASSIAGLAEVEPGLGVAVVADALRTDYRIRLSLRDTQLPETLAAHLRGAGSAKQGELFHVDDWARAHPWPPVSHAVGTGMDV
ncbi:MULTISPECIES: hypothetical protein [unclassified Nocardioides]|uniref:hypothetical protein n=1 Tax=unclassified Nocardioides TaxID=2615069 RepID=UPI00361E1A7E